MDFEKGKISSSQPEQLLPHTSVEGATSYEPKPARRIGWIPRVAVFLGAVVLLSRGYVSWSLNSEHSAHPDAIIYCRLPQRLHAP